MMSDHWKLLANLLGTPGPADPPETQRSKEAAAGKESSAGSPTRSDAPAAAQPAKDQPAKDQPAKAEPAKSDPARTAAAAGPARKRSSMWGDDTEGEAVVEKPSPKSPSAPSVRSGGSSIEDAPHHTKNLQTRPVSEETTVDALVAIVSVKREAPVPGFEVPEQRSPEPPQAPQKRSAWDALIGTLGIKPAGDVEVKQLNISAPSAPPAAKENEREKETGRNQQRQSAEPSGFGAGLVQWDDEPAEARHSTSARAAAGDATDRPAVGDADEDRPRGRGRRGGSRNRGRGGEVAPEPETRREPQAAWEDDPQPPEPRSRSAADTDAPDRPRHGDVRSAAEGTRADAHGDDEGDADPRQRRGRRRGQRQSLSVSDLDAPRAPSDPAGPRSDFRSSRSDEAGAPRRDAAGARGREPRGERSDESRPERTARSGPRDQPRAERDQPRAERDQPRAERGERQQEGRRSEVRSGRGQPQGDAPAGADDDLIDGFGSGLLDDGAAAPSSDDEVRTRPRRRRGRRGRGGAGLREEETQGSETAAPGDQPWAPLSEAPEFDDDLEDDDEAEQIRRRSRGSRTRSARREGGPSDRGPQARAAGEPVSRSEPRQSEPREPKDRDAPTWLDTVSLLVDANIQRRRSGGGGGGGSARGQGRGGSGGRR